MMDFSDGSHEEAYTKRVVEMVKSISTPQLTHAYVSQVSTDGHHTITITTKWTQKNVQLSKNDTFSVLYHYDGVTRNLKKISPPLERSSILLEKISPSLQQTAVIKKHVNETTKKTEYVLELWSNTDNKRTKSVNLTSLEKHGQVHSTGMFGRVSWSEDEKKIVYVAEKKKPKTCGFFEKQSEGCVPGNQYEYTESWGEQLTEICETVLCIFSTTDDNVKIVEGIPHNICPIQPIFGSGTTIIFAGLCTSPFRLGSIYCPNRPAGMYCVDYTDNQTNATVLMSPQLSASYNPQLNKAKTKLLFNHYKLSGKGDPHRFPNSLMMYDMVKGEVEPLCSQFNHGGDEVALYVSDECDYNVWLSDDVHVVVDNIFDGRHYVCVVDTMSGMLKSRMGCSSVLGLYNNLILATSQKQTSLSYNLTLMDASNPEQIILTKQEAKSKADFEAGDFCDEYGIRSFYLLPNIAEGEVGKSPLVVSPHGGPHSTFTDDYYETSRLLCQLGYAVLLVNYRGSIGYDASSLRSLPGNVGTQDVKDVQDVVQHFIKLKLLRIDTDNIFVLGGSHGGFLGAHLIGQFPDFYRAACLRNPVIELGSMAVNSDIPDWTYVEAGLEYTQDILPTGNSVSNMLSKSPIIHAKKVLAPVMLHIGGKDARVPPSQGLHYFRVLKANGKVVKMLYYPNDCHPLSSVDTSVDCIVNICKWFYTHGTHSREQHIKQ